MWGAVASLFFLSGFTSLAYETVWIRVLSLGIGSTSTALSLVLSLFFLGLSVGSWLSSRYLTNSTRPLRVYAWLEGVIGLSALLLLFVLLHFQTILTLLPLEGTFGWLGVLAKFSLAGLLLACPTLAMGATLPLVVKVFELLPRHGNNHGSVALLYSINTLGGMVGALAASFWLIPKLGLHATNATSAITNFALFGLGLWLDRKSSENTSPASVAPAKLRWNSFSPSQQRLVLLSGVCGFSSIASEVTWNKYLGIFLGNNIYGLGIVLGIYLLGIGLGSLATHFALARRRNAEKLFWRCLLSLPFAIVLTTLAFNSVPPLSATLGYYLAGWIDLFWIKCTVAALLLLPSTLLLGALLPLTIHLIAHGRSEEHSSVGFAYAVNTVGAILGSCFAGLWIIPHFGSSVSMKVAVGSLVAFSLYTLSKENASWRRLVPAFVGLALVLGCGSFDFRNLIKSAYLQRISSTVTLEQIRELYSPAYEEFQWIREGKTSIITLSHDPKDGSEYREYLRLKTNGLNESIYQKSRLQELPRYEALLGLLPYLFSDNPRSAFIVGFGGGYTVDLMTTLPLPKIHVVELDQAIVEASQYVYHGKNPILERKNLNLTIEDARFVLAAKLKAPLDIIVSQPSHSWLAGAANLFTQEFFEIVRSNLSERGVFSQWLNLYNMDDHTLQSILKTFYAVFPHGAVFSGQGDQEMILVGSVQPLRFNAAEASRLASSGMMAAKLSGVPFNAPSDILSHFALGRESVLEATAGAPLNTDVNAYAETRQSRSFYAGIPEEQSPQKFLTQHFKGGYLDLLTPGQDWAYPVLLSLEQTGQYHKLFAVLRDYEAKAAQVPEHQSKLGYLCLRSQRYQSAHRYLAEAFRTSPTRENFNMHLSALSELNDHRNVLKTIVSHPKLQSRVSECYQVNSLVSLGRAAQATPLVSKMVGDISGFTQVCGDYFNLTLGDYYFARSEYEISARFYEAYRARFPSDVAALRNLNVAYLRLDKFREAQEVAKALSAWLKSERSRLQSLAEFYAANGLAGDASALSARVPGQAE